MPQSQCARLLIVLGPVLYLFHAAVGHGQNVGSWRSTPPDSKTIEYDGKGRRLFWDDNGQLVGRYSFHTGKYRAVVSAEQRSAASLPIDPWGKRPAPAKLAIVHWGKIPEHAADTSTTRTGPKIISGGFPTVNVVRHIERVSAALDPPAVTTARADASRTSATLAIEPMGMP